MPFLWFSGWRFMGREGSRIASNTSWCRSPCWLMVIQLPLMFPATLYTSPCFPPCLPSLTSECHLPLMHHFSSCCAKVAACVSSRETPCQSTNRELDPVGSRVSQPPRVPSKSAEPRQKKKLTLSLSRRKLTKGRRSCSWTPRHDSSARGKRRLLPASASGAVRSFTLSTGNLISTTEEGASSPTPSSHIRISA